MVVTTRLIRVGVLKLGVCLGLLYALGSLLLVPFLLLALMGSAVVQGEATVEIGKWVASTVVAATVMVFLPAVYGVVGFVSGVLLAVLYNFTARVTGGLELQLLESPPQPPPPQ